MELAPAACCLTTSDSAGLSGILGWFGALLRCSSQRQRHNSQCCNIKIGSYVPGGSEFSMSNVVEANSQEIASRVRGARWKKIGLIFLLLVLAFAVAAWQRPLTLIRTAGRVTLLTHGIHGHYAQVGGYRVHYYEGGD